MASRLHIETYCWLGRMWFSQLSRLVVATKNATRVTLLDRQHDRHATPRSPSSSNGVAACNLLSRSDESGLFLRYGSVHRVPFGDVYLPRAARCDPIHPLSSFATIQRPGFSNVQPRRMTDDWMSGIQSDFAMPTRTHRMERRKRKTASLSTRDKACFPSLLRGALSRFHSYVLLLRVTVVTAPRKPAEVVLLTRFKNSNGPSSDGTAESFGWNTRALSPNSIQNFHQIRRTFFSVPSSLFRVRDNSLIICLV
jgi:hypothetical protein